MKVIVAGSRNFNDYKLLCEKLTNLLRNIKHPVIVCGEARGADTLGKRYAEELGIEIMSFPADWKKEGKAAGYKRNERMAVCADALVAFWDGKSKGTEHMINTMKSLNKPIRIIKY